MERFYCSFFILYRPHKPMRYIFFLLICLPLLVSAQKTFEFNEQCVAAYRQILSLKIAGGQQLLDAQKRQNPDNLAPFFLENYIDFFVLFFNEDPEEYKKRKANRSVRLGLMKKGPSNSPLTLFTQSIINLQWAAVEIKFNNRWAAGWAFRDAFKLAIQNRKKFPTFSPNYMVTGPMQMVAATIPKNMQWLSNMMGISGSMQDGKLGLQRFLSATDAWGRLFHDEGVFYQCYLQFYLQNQADEALAFIQNQRLDVVNNHLFTYMAANLNLNNKRSLSTQQIVQQRNTSGEYLATAVWDFEMAYARLFHLEPDASIYFERFLQQFKGNFYVKDAWLKLGWHYLLAGNLPQYQRCLQNVLVKGNTATEADKRALKEAKLKEMPNVLLLKARLLNDGGYHREALNLLAGKNDLDFASLPEQLEFMYRVGRINDDLGLTDRALQAYDATIAKGRNRTEYYAARACLQAGLLCEEKGNKTRAIQYYETCIGLEKHDFEDAIEQRAKAGIARCTGK
jgi:Tetratricopeptide repeat